MLSVSNLKTAASFMVNGIRNMSYIPKNRLEGKIAVVTASTDGIGYAIAKRLGQEGAKIIVSSRKQKNVDSAVSRLKSEGINVTGVVCHVSKAEDRKRVFDEADKLGGLDILVSNAAANPEAGNILECSEVAWDKIFEVNVKAAFLLAKDGLPLFRRRGGGSIIFISSIAGYQPISLLGAYSVSKTALLGLTKAVATDLASENIRVNCIAPGIIKTKFSQALTEEENTSELILNMVPMKRFGTPEDISGIVTFLASDDASYITGETIVATGGMSSRL